MIFFFYCLFQFWKEKKGNGEREKKNIFIDIATLYESAS